MKKIIKYIMPLALLFVFASCKKNTGVTNQPYDTYGTPANKGQLKVNLAFAYAIDYANLCNLSHKQRLGSLLADPY